MIIQLALSGGGFIAVSSKHIESIQAVDRVGTPTVTTTSGERFTTVQNYSTVLEYWSEAVGVDAGTALPGEFSAKEDDEVYGEAVHSDND